MTAEASASRFARIGRDGTRTEIGRNVAEEVPVAIEVNGLAYAVLMATPAEIDELAIGFALAERLIDAIGDLVDCEVHRADAGVLARLTLVPYCAERVTDRMRHRVADSSCGLCGVESLEQAMRPLPPLGPGALADDAAVFAALDTLSAHQPLNRATRAVHVAASCARDGAIRMVREDVGRHNAFDKLIGAMARAETGWDGGFALLSSRCSYELVEKAVLARCPMLVTISAPTALALRRAEAAGLALRVVARPDAMLAPA